MREKAKNFIYSKRGLYFLWALVTIYAGYSVCYLLNIAGFAEQIDHLGFTQSALSVLCFVVVGYFLRGLYQEYKSIEDKQIRKRRFLFAFLFGSALALSFIFGYQLRISGNTLPGYKNKLRDALMALGCGLALLPLTDKWFALLDHVKTGECKADLAKRTQKKLFWFSFLGIILCWIPVFLAYYPAIMSYDFNRQSIEACRGYIWFNDHHPLMHTWLIRVFLVLGKTLGSYEVGMAIFSALQMLLLATILAYSCNVLGRISRRKWPVTVMVLIYGLLPVHPVLAMSMTKDILFTAFFLLLILLIWEKRRFTESLGIGKCLVPGEQKITVTTADRFKRIGLTIAILLTGILVMLLRNNAVYAFAVFAVFYVIASYKERVLTAILCIAIIVGGLGGKIAIREAMDAGSGSSVEMCSVFIQQLARVGNKQGAALTEDERAIIAHYVPEELWGDYNPPISDSVKAMVAAYYYSRWEEDFLQMLSDWIKIGLRYPNEYIDAFLALTSGYWFMDDVSHAEVLTYGEDTNLGLLYTFNASVSEYFEGVESRSLFPGLLEAYQKIVNGNSYYGLPIVSILFKPAFYCWVLLLAMVSYWYRKEPKKQLLALFPFIYLLTLLLGPVVNMRYVYPIMVVVPVLLASVFCTEKQRKESTTNDSCAEK